MRPLGPSVTLTALLRISTPRSNRSRASDTGLGAWTKADRDLVATDLVVWYNFGQTHIPRVEDWPVMPATSVSFMLKPDGFFNANPALDVPAPPR